MVSFRHIRTAVSSWRQIAKLLLLLAVSLLIGGSPSKAFAQPPLIDDDFNDNFLNPSLWSVLGPPPGFVVNVSETNQRLEITVVSAGFGGGGIISNCFLAGDFDVQVDYTLINWPATNLHSVRLGAFDLGVGPGGGVGLNRSSFPNSILGTSEFYLLATLDSTPQIATTVTSGTLALVRTGATLSGFVRDGTNFVLVGLGAVSTIETRINLDLGGGDASAPGGIQAAFDNFKVNAGTVVCPPLSSQFLERFGQLVEVFEISNPVDLVRDQTTLDTLDDAIAFAEGLIFSIEGRQMSIGEYMKVLADRLSLAFRGFFFLDFDPNCTLIFEGKCIVFGEIGELKVSNSPESTFQLFRFDVSVNVEKPGEEFFEPGDRFVTDIPVLGPGPTFSIVEVLNVVDPPEFGTIELRVEGVRLLPTEIPLDIKPGSDTNSINPKSRGVIPVAILSTNDFDATSVDPLSVEFGPAGGMESHGRGHIEDVDGDGDLDLLLHFRTQETGIAPGSTEACLTGETLDGTTIQGCDAVRTL